MTRQESNTRSHASTRQRPQRHTLESAPGLRVATSTRPRVSACLLLSALCLLFSAGCGRRDDSFVTVLDANPATLDQLRGTDAASERLRQLMFNSLVRKNERFEYVGELAENIVTSPDGLSVTFTLRDGVTFHDGRPLTSADAKYTLDTLFASDSPKAGSFFEATPGGRQPFVTAVEAPDPRTLVLRLRRPWPQLLSNLVSFGIIPQGSADTQKDNPLGSGPFRFVSYDESQQVADLEAFESYWGGAPQIKKLRVRGMPEASTLQAELRSGGVDLAAVANLSPDAFNELGNDPKLKIEKHPGANVVYLSFNAESEFVKDARVRQAVAHAVDREGIVRDLLRGQATVANSILPVESWAYAGGQNFTYDPQRAKRLLDEAGFRDPDGDGPQMRFPRPVSFKISPLGRTYAAVIQDQLKQVGIPANIESFEAPTLLDQLRKGQFQMTTARWVGGNQDPIFLRDLFHSANIPPNGSAFNRGRYRNYELDRILDEAANTPPDAQRERARALYAQAQEIIHREVPMLPLWYPANMVVARKGVNNIKIAAGGDFNFLAQVTVEE